MLFVLMFPDTSPTVGTTTCRINSPVVWLAGTSKGHNSSLSRCYFTLVSCQISELFLFPDSTVPISLCGLCKEVCLHLYSCLHEALVSEDLHLVYF